MIDILEYAHLSGHIYHPARQRYFTMSIYPISQSELYRVKGEGWYLVDGIDRHMIAQNSYFAALYVKFQNGRPIDAVVSIRGTVQVHLCANGPDYKPFMKYNFENAMAASHHQAMSGHGMPSEVFAIA